MLEDNSQLEERRREHFIEAGGKKEILFGAAQVDGFIKKVVAGEKVAGFRHGYNLDFVLEINRRVVQAPSPSPFNRDKLINTLIRKDDTKKLGFRDLGHFYNLPPMLYKYGEWLSNRMSDMNNHEEDVVWALETAAAAHYGLVMHAFHPFDNGNGRTARAVMNSILMSGSYELTAHNWAIPPVPIVRDERTSSKYIQDLNSVNETRLLNPFMGFIARRWVESSESRLEQIHRVLGKSVRRESDKKLVTKLERRIEKLKGFVAIGNEKKSNGNGNGNGNGHGNGHSNGNGNHFQEFVVPEYFLITPRE